MLTLALSFVLGLVPTAWAQEVNVAIDPAASRQAGVDADDAEAQIEAATSGTLQLDEPQAFLDQMANANALATTGMGVDYASNPQRFYGGASIGTATSGGAFEVSQGTSPLEGPGFAFQASATVGVNVGMLADDASFWRRVVLSANGVVARNTTGPFEAEMENVGAHVQLKALPGKTLGLVSWGGLDLTTGYEVSSYRLLLANTLPVETEDLRWDATGTLDLRAESRTIPFEISTNARIFFLTGYAGAAIDLRRSATADGEVALDGPLLASVRGEDRTIGTVDARLGLTGTTAEMSPRLFGGLQVNVLFVKVYGHLNVAADETYAGHVGARIAL